MKKWDIDSLFFEAKAIKERMSRTKTKRYVDEYKEYNKYMSTGKISIAILSLTVKAKGGVHSLTDKVDKKTVLDVLRKKHPEPCKAISNYLVGNEHPKSLPYHQSIFEKLNASIVRKSAMKTHGSHGLSSLDANELRRLLTSFRLSSTDLCKLIAKLAIRIATSHLIFLLLPHNSCRLIAFDN